MGERLALHSREVDRVISELGGALEAVPSESGWAAVKCEYGALLPGERNRELAETFFNSVTRACWTPSA